DSERLVRRILKEDLQLDPKKWNPRAVRGAISAAKNELRGVGDLSTAALDPFARVVARAYERYETALREANAFDFDDLLVKPVEILSDCPEVLANYRAPVHVVLVDEYQDPNHAQYVFLRLVATPEAPSGSSDIPGRGGNLFVVGDDDQSIYGWRGANIRNIL